MFLHIWTRQALAHFAAMAIVLVGFIVIWPNSMVHAKVDLDSPLLVSTRESLRVCTTVDPKLEAQRSEIAQRLTERMQQLQTTHPDWDKIYDKVISAPPFETDCTATIPTNLLDPADATVIGKGLVKNPSPFRAIVLVLDDDTADVVLGKLDVSHAAYEMMQVSEYEAVEVTNALVVRNSFIGTQEFVDQYLSVAVGLNPIKPYELPDDEQSPTIKPANHDADQ